MCYLCYNNRVSVSKSSQDPVTLSSVSVQSINAAVPELQHVGTLSTLTHIDPYPTVWHEAGGVSMNPTARTQQQIWGSGRFHITKKQCDIVVSPPAFVWNPHLTCTNVTFDLESNFKEMTKNPWKNQVIQHGDLDHWPMTFTFIQAVIIIKGIYEMITLCLVNICSKIFKHLKILWPMMQKM